MAADSAVLGPGFGPEIRRDRFPHAARYPAADAAGRLPGELAAEEPVREGCPLVYPPFRQPSPAALPGWRKMTGHALKTRANP